MFDNVEIKFLFEFGYVKNKTMTVKFIGDDIVINPTGEKFVEQSLFVNLPKKIKIDFSGKDMKNDTIIEDNKIIADKFVKICSIKLDMFPINEVYLQQNIVINCENQSKIATNYVGFNGYIDLNLNKTNIFEQIMAFS